MVPATMMSELRSSFEDLRRRKIDLVGYAGLGHAAAFDLITTDSFVAGIATKILDGSSVESNERAAVEKPFLVEGNTWRLVSGEVFDLRDDTELRELAISIERVRECCYKILWRSTGH